MNNAFCELFRRTLLVTTLAWCAWSGRAAAEDLEWPAMDDPIRTHGDVRARHLAPFIDSLAPANASHDAWAALVREVAQGVVGRPVVLHALGYSESGLGRDDKRGPGILALALDHRGQVVTMRLDQADTSEPETRHWCAADLALFRNDHLGPGPEPLYYVDTLKDALLKRAQHSIHWIAHELDLSVPKNGADGSPKAVTENLKQVRRRAEQAERRGNAPIIGLAGTGLGADLALIVDRLTDRVPEPSLRDGAAFLLADIVPGNRTATGFWAVTGTGEVVRLDRIVGDPTVEFSARDHFGDHLGVWRALHEFGLERRDRVDEPREVPRLTQELALGILHTSRIIRASGARAMEVTRPDHRGALPKIVGDRSGKQEFHHRLRRAKAALTGRSYRER